MYVLFISQENKKRKNKPLKKGIGENLHELKWVKQKQKKKEGK